jgi:threonine 3-dehydrogenase
MALLITGGTGFIGSQLARLAVAEGQRPVLLDPAPPGPSLADIVDQVEYVRSSLNSLSSLIEILRRHEADTVFHLGGMLSVPSEDDPWSAYEVNIQGTYRLLEAARLCGASKFILASSIAVYSQDLPAGPADETSVEHPTSFYGVGKVCGELMGRFYQRRFGLDFRALRLPSVVGPGSQVPHMSIYNCWAIEKPLLNEPYQILVEPKTRCPVVYFKEGARGLWQLSQAPAADIKTRVYNINGVLPPYSAQELVEAVTSLIPQARLSFAPDPKISQMMQHIGRLQLDDSRARAEWGWRSAYDLVAMVRQFIADFQAGHSVPNH